MISRLIQTRLPLITVFIMILSAAVTHGETTLMDIIIVAGKFRGIGIPPNVQARVDYEWRRFNTILLSEIYAEMMNIKPKHTCKSSPLSPQGQMIRIMKRVKKREEQGKDDIELVAIRKGIRKVLCEAYWLDNDRCDVWAFLTLIHLRKENWELSDACFRKTMEFAEESGDELLLEIAIEYMAAQRVGNSELAEVAARMALKLRETGQGHEVLADALAQQELYEKGVLECSVAIRLLYDNPKQRERIVNKAIEWAEILNDPPLAESIHISEKLANLSLQDSQGEEKKNETQQK